MGGDSAPAAPDYTPMANASEAAARIGAEQADRVLAESTRQYDRNMAVAQPILDSQAAMMKSAQQQGDEYYDYWKTKARPVEDALNAEAFRRLIRSLKSQPGFGAALAEAARDEVVYAVLRRHGILKPSLFERVEAALETVRPMLASHGGNAEVAAMLAAEKLLLEKSA